MPKRVGLTLIISSKFRLNDIILSVSASINFLVLTKKLTVPLRLMCDMRVMHILSSVPLEGFYTESLINTN